MKNIINIVIRVSGLGWIVNKVNGYKAFLGGTIQILGGLATLLSGLANILGELAPLTSAGEYYAYFQSLSHNPSAAIVAAGVLAIGKGLADIGNRHALDKQTVQIVGEPTK